MEQRIQKILSQAGVASRRKAEALIREGFVTINGKAAVPGMKADPFKDHIKVKNKLVITHQVAVYMAFHKPRGCLTTLSDPKGRTTIMSYLKSLKSGIYPVGRLDYNSEGIILLTNDGDFAQTILHPKNKIEKTYHVKVTGVLDEEELEKLGSGIKLEDGMTKPALVKKLEKLKSNSWLEITIYEGKNRQIRRMFEHLGHTVKRLIRVSIGPVKLGTLPAGRYRNLTEREMNSLYTYIQRDK
jgi:23S rRNA pseudouridine2605 synthase